MQELALHIEYLLKRHDCVIVPGFGAFLASRRRAAYSPEGVLPSSVEFFFNSAVCNDDGLLASSFARRNRLSFEEARLVLAEESESLRTAIDSYGEATIGRVGVLRRGEEGTITFHPLRSAQAYAEAIGMPPIRLAGITSDDETKKQEGEKSGKTARKFRTDRNYYIAINKVFARTAVCFALVAAVSLSLMLGRQTIQNEQQYASIVPVAVKAPQTTVSPKETKKASATRPEPAVRTKTISETDHQADTDRFFLIVATFRTQTEADRFISHNNDSRLHSVASGKMVRVAAAASSVREDLQAMMRDKDFRADYSDCWIWEKPQSTKN